MSRGEVCLSSLLTGARQSIWTLILRDSRYGGGGGGGGWWLVDSLLIASGFCFILQ